MSIGQVLLILWRRGWIAVLTLVTTIIVATSVLFFVPGRYDAVATASIDPGGLDPVTSTGSGSGTAIALMQGNMIQLVSSQRVALDVVKRLNLTASPTVQAQYRASESFGREGIDDWMASSVLKSVEPKFTMGTNVLSIKYKTGDPKQAALIANAFLASTVDATIAMRAASGDQTARWFAPQIDEMRKELDSARAALENFQAQTNFVAPSTGADTESSALMAISQQLQGNKAALSAMQSRLASGDTSLSTDPSDPDAQMVNGIKERIATEETSIETGKTVLGANNPKILSAIANVAALRRQLADATAKMREHLPARIALVKDQIAKLEASQAAAQKDLIAAQAQRDRFGELARDVGFRLEQLNAQERMAAQARLQSKLTFAGISVLDKATPPIAPSFPKPTQVIMVGIGAGLSLGLILALLAEMLDRRVRVGKDLEFASSAPLLGVINKARLGGGRRSKGSLSLLDHAA